MTTAYPYILVVNPTLPVKKPAGSSSRSPKPSRANSTTARPGVGAANHLVFRVVQRQGRKSTWYIFLIVATALAVTDLIAGAGDDGCLPIRFRRWHISRPARCAPLAVTSKERSAVAPDVPTIAGKRPIRASMAIGWHGILAPAKTPPRDRSRSSTTRSSRRCRIPTPRLCWKSRRCKRSAIRPRPSRAFIGQDIAIWKEVATQANVEVK